MTAGAAAAGLALPMSLQGKSASSARVDPSKIIYRELGKTGIKLPIMSLGVMRADNPNLVSAALDAGMVHLDTAHGYQNGNNELMLGKLLKERKRDSFVISTKMHLPSDRSTGLFTADATYDKFMSMLNTSLERLQMDHVDILYLHAVSAREAALNEDMLRALSDAKKQGKARFLGISTHSKEPVVIQAAIDSKLYDLILTSYNFAQPHVAEMKQSIAKAKEAGLGIVAMKTMAGGYLDRERTKPVNAKAALRWALQDPNVDTAIPGATTFDHLNEMIEVMSNLNFSDEEKSFLQAYNGGASLYCSGCRECIPQCPHNLAVPEIMRSYMYTYGYKDAGLAQDEINSLAVAELPCNLCETCSVSCTNGFAVKDRISDVWRLKQVPREFIA
ncbi:MAG: oxidoreductase [Bacteroidetes bacterium]|nr:oxidoreductase [Bacteroidales bacterium]NJO69700.1 oxidoreductase [Bacteroidota bacterium]